MTPSPDSLPILNLPDDLFMLALCVREENLRDPARWCAEMREHARAVKRGPKTIEEAEALMETATRLAEESAGEREQVERIVPEVRKVFPHLFPL